MLVPQDPVEYYKQVPEGINYTFEQNFMGEDFHNETVIVIHFLQYPDPGYDCCILYVFNEICGAEFYAPIDGFRKPNIIEINYVKLEFHFLVPVSQSGWQGKIKYSNMYGLLPRGIYFW